MSSFACWNLSLTLLVLFCSPGSGEAFEVYIWSEKQIVQATEAWKVNCSTTCAAPEIGGLETSTNKLMLEEDPHGKWKEFLVSNATVDTVLFCHFTCSGKQLAVSFNIRVYGFLCVALAVLELAL